MKKLPTYEELLIKEQNKESFSALDDFIFNWEPAGEEHCKDFRERLLKAINEVVSSA